MKIKLTRENALLQFLLLSERMSTIFDGLFFPKFHGQPKVFKGTFSGSFTLKIELSRAENLLILRVKLQPRLNGIFLWKTCIRS